MSGGHGLELLTFAGGCPEVHQCLAWALIGGRCRHCLSKTAPTQGNDPGKGSHPTDRVQGLQLFS